MDFKNKIEQVSGEAKPENIENRARRRASPWLKYYSAQIARRILAALEEKDWSQKKLAGELNVSDQQISKIVKGKENLTLETIYKLSAALSFDLISFPEYKYSAAIYNPIPKLKSTTPFDFGNNVNLQNWLGKAKSIERKQENVTVGQSRRKVAA
jgi:transcriptional regulator with XRE-family HTH domain